MCVGNRTWIQSRDLPFLFHLESKECTFLFLTQVAPTMGVGIVEKAQAGPSVWRKSQLVAPNHSQVPEDAGRCESSQPARCRGSGTPLDF